MTKGVKIPIGADDAELRRKLKGAKAQLAAFSKSVRSNANAFAKWGAAATGAAAGATAAIYKSQSQVIDQLAKTSDALGIQIEKMQALQHVAELSGVSAEQMAKGLQRMERGLGEAARKGGTTADALKDAGVSISEMLALSPDEQITKLAGAIGKMENQSIKASVASDLFGRDGVKMLKVLTQLEKEGLKPTEAELKKMGVTLSRLDAAKVEEANDAFFKVSQIIASVGNQLTVKLAPYVTAISNRFTQAAKDAGGFGNMVSGAIKRALKAIGFMGDMLQGLRVVFKGVELIAVGFGAAAVSVFQGVFEAIVMLTDGATKNINKVINGLNKIKGVNIDSIPLLTDSGMAESFREVGDAARNHLSAVRTEMQALALQELPSEKLKEFQEAAVLAATETANKVAFAQAEALVSGEGSQFLAEVRAEENEKQVQEERDKLDKFKEVWDDGYSSIANIISTKYGMIKGETVGAFKSILQTAATGSKKAFDIAKKWALVDAAISMYQGIAAGVKLGWPMAIPAVAWAAATGLKQIQQIKSQNFGGAGGAAASGGGAPATAPNPVNVGGGAQGGGGSNSTLFVDGIDSDSLFSGDVVKSLASKLIEHQRNGGEVVLT